LFEVFMKFVPSRLFPALALPALLSGLLAVCGFMAPASMARAATTTVSTTASASTATSAASSIAQPQAPIIAAKAYLLMDITSNQVLTEKDADSPIEPASLTKLMTAYIVFDALRAKKIDLKQTLSVSERAWKMPGSRMFIDPKMKVPVEDLLKGMIVQSGNDATVALAEGVAGSVERFVQLMNEQAKVLGMSKTVYKNPEGLTEAGHTTSARDLGLLALLRDQKIPPRRLTGGQRHQPQFAAVS
jgi:serine-type D-Ala-D-Ala carboxypeptidase (penicillin-binding protein 5/6)